MAVELPEGRTLQHDEYEAPVAAVLKPVVKLGRP